MTTLQAAAGIAPAENLNSLRLSIIADAKNPLDMLEHEKERYMTLFKSWLEHSEFYVEMAEQQPDNARAQKQAESELAFLPRIHEAIKALEDHEIWFKEQTALKPLTYKVGTKLRVNTSFRLSEFDVKEGHQGTRARLDAYDMSCVPAGKIPVRFKVELFGFERHEEFTSLVLYIPNFLLDEV